MNTPENLPPTRSKTRALLTLPSRAGIGPAQDQVEVTVSVTPQAVTDVTRGLILSGTMNVGRQPVVRVTSAIPLRIVPTSQ
jgi:hypothetical protein